jgi:hypothetical protein
VNLTKQERYQSGGFWASSNIVNCKRGSIIITPIICIIKRSTQSLVLLLRILILITKVKFLNYDRIRVQFKIFKRHYKKKNLVWILSYLKAFFSSSVFCTCPVLFHFKTISSYEFSNFHINVMHRVEVLFYN